MTSFFAVMDLWRTNGMDVSTKAMESFVFNVPKDILHATVSMAMENLYVPRIAPTLVVTEHAILNI